MLIDKVRTTPALVLRIIIGLNPLPLCCKLEAMLACSHMNNTQWAETIFGHSGTKNCLNANAEMTDNQNYR